MDLITVRELYKHPENFLDKEVSIGGWVRSLRDSKAFGFIVVSDGSYFETLQDVYKRQHWRRSFRHLLRIRINSEET